MTRHTQPTAQIVVGDLECRAGVDTTTVVPHAHVAVVLTHAYVHMLSGTCSDLPVKHPSALEHVYGRLLSLSDWSVEGMCSISKPHTCTLTPILACVKWHHISLDT